MLPIVTPGSGRLRDIEGSVPLHVVVWLEQHPTAALACALAATSPSVRWHFRLSPTLEVVLRGARVEVLDSPSATRVGTARIHGVRSAADFDSLPRAIEPPPFSLPPVPFPATAGFACDRDGAIARFHALGGNAAVSGPALLPRLTGYDDSAPPRVAALVAALATGHDTMAHPVRAFAARVRDLVTVLALPSVVGGARLYSWFEDERVVVWPAGPSELVSSVVAALHARRLCLGCSRLDPRDRLGRGTYAYARSPRSMLESYLREDVPVAPLDVAEAAQLLGRSPAELAATQLEVRFVEALRVDLTRMRWAT